MNHSPDFYLGLQYRFPSGLLDIGKKETEFIIFNGEDPILTPLGKPFAHASERVIRSVLTDIQLRDLYNFTGIAYANLFAYKTDVVDGSLDCSPSALLQEVLADPFVRLKIVENQSLRTFSPDEPLFNFSFLTLSGLISDINQYIASLMGEILIEESEAHPLPELIVARYDGLDAWKKAAFQLIRHLHHSGVILPLGLVTGLIDPATYTKGMLALKIQSAQDYSVLFQQASDVRSFLSTLDTNDLNPIRIKQIIQQGEGDRIEFKSTLRWDIRAGKTNQVIERACLKSISAFLNSGGGYLLIGVRDDGTIEGIETDKFPNEDKFLLHLWTLIRTCLGRDFSPYIRTILEKAGDNKTVCLVHCNPAPRPVFLRQPGFDEEMYIRIGPSSNALDISEALKYIRNRFRNED